ncbi:MAG TPA: RNA polymerase sigma-70 factor [Puia sp.]
MSISQEHLYGRFQTVFNTYYNSLCNYAFTFVKNEDTSEDIVQDIFMRIWEGRRDLLLEDTVRYYLFTAVRNNSITHLRQQKNTEEWNGEDIPDETVPEKERGNDRDYRLSLQKGIDRLPPKCREVFLLSRFSNMTYKQIAASLGISVKTVENQLGKALKNLRVFLKEEGIYLVGLLIGFFL